MTATYIDTEHFFHYDTKNPVTAAALAESLLGIEAIVKRSGGVLGKLLDVKIKDTEVLITSFQVGSYREHFLFRFFFGKGKAGEKAVEKLRTQLGLKNMDLPKATGWAVVGAILFAAWKFYPAADAPARVHIENSFNNMGQSVGMTKDEVIALFQAAIGNTEDLKKSVSKLAHPGGQPHVGALKINDDSTLEVPAEVMAAIPPKYKRDEAEEPFRDYDNAVIVIRAIDLDRPASGWAGIVAEISDKRLPFVLADGLDPATVPAGKNTSAAITVIYKVDKFGNREPKRYLLRKVHANQPLAGN